MNYILAAREASYLIYPIFIYTLDMTNWGNKLCYSMLHALLLFPAAQECHLNLNRRWDYTILHSALSLAISLSYFLLNPYFLGLYFAYLARYITLCLPSFHPRRFSSFWTQEFFHPHQTYKTLIQFWIPLWLSYQLPLKNDSDKERALIFQGLHYVNEGLLDYFIYQEVGYFPTLRRFIQLHSLFIYIAFALHFLTMPSENVYRSLLKVNTACGLAHHTLNRFYFFQGPRNREAVEQTAAVMAENGW